MTLTTGTPPGADAPPRDLVELDREHLWHPWTAATPSDPLLIVAGQGCVVADAVGRRYLDARAGMFNATLGYGHPAVVAAIEAQARTLMTYPLVGAATAPAVRLAARLAALLGEPLTRTLFCHSGSEATEAAIKIARLYHGLVGWPQRTIVLSLADGYHGSTMAAVAASGLAATRSGCEPMPPDFVQVATPRCAACAAGRPHRHDVVPGVEALAHALQTHRPERVAAFIVEPVLGVAGVIPLPDGYLAAVSDLCHRHGVLMIVDEVMTGLGRTGVWFAHQQPGVHPDLVTTAKGLTAGYAALASVTTTAAIADVFRADPLLGGLRHGHTTGGHAIACAAALAVLRVIEDEDLVTHAAAVGVVLRGQLHDRLTGLAGVVEVRGVGLLAAVELDSVDRATAVATSCRDHGVLIRQQGPVITVAPPLIITPAQAQQITVTLRAGVLAAEALT